MLRVFRSKKTCFLTFRAGLNADNSGATILWDLGSPEPLINLALDVVGDVTEALSAALCALLRIAQHCVSRATYITASFPGHRVPSFLAQSRELI